MKKIERIAFATDFSMVSEKAKYVAVNLKDTLGCKLDVIHVYDSTSLMMPIPYGAMPGVELWVNQNFGAFREQGRRALDELCPELGDGCRAVFLEGVPGKTIVEYAEKNDIDLIIMGTHGHSGLDRLMLGSIAEYVVRHASCPVMTLKNDA